MVPASARGEPFAAGPASGATPARARQVLYWAATVFTALAFSVPGIGNLVRAPHIAQDMAHLGYPPYFLVILGTWKVLGAVAVVAPRLPRLKEWAYAGMIFDLTGAAMSRAAVGDGATMVLVPLMISGVVLASWLLRPPARRLQPSHDDRGRRG
jgi:uncharacterized membrane protein YphA (DoxX/SURF4 family)